MSVAPLLDSRAGHFADFVETEPSAEALSALWAAETSGRPLGSAAFLNRLAALLSRYPRLKRRGPKPRVEGLSSCRPCAQGPLLAHLSRSAFERNVPQTACS